MNLFSAHNQTLHTRSQLSFIQIVFELGLLLDKYKPFVLSLFFAKLMQRK